MSGRPDSIQRTKQLASREDSSRTDDWTLWNLLPLFIEEKFLAEGGFSLIASQETQLFPTCHCADPVNNPHHSPPYHRQLVHCLSYVDLKSIPLGQSLYVAQTSDFQ